jgi:hypothetical protein
MRLIKHVLARVASWIDIADIAFFSGLLLLAYGLHLVYEPLAYIGIGGLLIAVVLVPRLGGKKND